MIDLYTGSPGSGKSLHCARTIYQRLRAGDRVIANFDINLSVFKQRKRGEFFYFDNSELSPAMLFDFAAGNHRLNTNGNMVEGQTLLVIDECQVMFNARDWNVRDRMAWCNFFMQHRKYGYDVVLITQFDRMLDRQIRSLVEYQIIHRKVSNFKLLGEILGLFAGGHLFVAVRQWYGVKEKIDSEFFRARAKYINMYNSYKIFDRTEQGVAKPGPRGLADQAS